MLDNVPSKLRSVTWMIGVEFTTQSKFLLRGKVGLQEYSFSAARIAAWHVS